MFKTLKLIFFLISLIAGYFAYSDAISLWWVLALIAATAIFKFLEPPSKTTPLTIEDSVSTVGKMDGPTGFDLEIAREDVMKFGQVMMEVDYLKKMYDVSNLPLEKEKILESLVTLYRAASDDVNRKRFKLGLMALTRFREGIGKDPVEIALDPTTHAIAEEEYAKYSSELEA